MATRTLGIIMNGVTGRMGLNQHLVRSIIAIRDQGGVSLPNGDRVMPDPILVGRNAEKITTLAKQYNIARTTTDLAAALKNPADTVFFDAATTQMRADLVTQAIEAGKHIYCEKPVADSLDKAIAIAKLARQKGVKNGVAASSRCVASSATGCSRATGARRRSARAGITRRPRAAASSSICCATGATCSITCSATCRR